MSDTQVSVTVVILDEEYRFKSPESEIEQLKTAAQFLDKKMRQTRSSSAQKMPLEKIAIITALNLTYEFLAYQNKTLEDAEKSNELIALLQEKLSQVLLPQNNNKESKKA